MDPVADARALVNERFPAALAAFLGAGVLSSRRTATSDLDIVVVLAGVRGSPPGLAQPGVRGSPPGLAQPPAPYRESLRWRGWPAETFVHDHDSLERFFAKDTARRRPTLARMCADGAVLTDTDGYAERVRQRARSVLAAGPSAATSAELEARRYGVTDLIDDLTGSTDPGETAVIGWNLWQQTAELALIQAGAWLGTVKWLLRELRTADPRLADQMVTAIGDRDRLIQVADEVLARVGGRFWAGYRVAS